MSVLFGGVERMKRNDKHIPPAGALTASSSASPPQIDISEAASRLLQFPAIASKSFLITIGDRTITGLVTRDQMVGPWQVPVADVAVVRAGYSSPLSSTPGGVRCFAGEAFSSGERPPLALLNPAASARIALAESLTNLAAAFVGYGAGDLKVRFRNQLSCLRHSASFHSNRPITHSLKSS